MTEHVVGDQWGYYWHVIPRLLEVSGYKEEEKKRLRREKRNDLKEEGRGERHQVLYGSEET